MTRFLLLGLSLFVLSGRLPGQSLLDSLGISVQGVSREFAYTNKESAFLYGETRAGNRTSWQGFNVYGHEFLDDYDLVADGRTLDRAAAAVTSVASAPV